VIGQGRLDIQRCAIGMIDDQAARMQVQLAADAARKEGVGAAIFAVAHNRVANGRHMDAQLVRAACQRLQFDPAAALPARSITR
jgi:hypothetical protein